MAVIKKRIYCALGYKCNNNCLFCAVDSVSKSLENSSTEELFSFFDTFENKKNIEFEISGGEPTIRSDFLDLMKYLKQLNSNNSYILLSNGRSFSNSNFTRKLSDVSPEALIIPIHGDTLKLHDLQTQSFGSFNETINGIDNLLDYSFDVDLKVIVNKLNYIYLPQIVQFIVQTYPTIKYVSLNWLDLAGSAIRNKNRVFIPFLNAIPYVQKALDVAVSNGLNIRTYSMPKCIFDEEYQSFVGVQLRPQLSCKTPSQLLDCVKWTSGTVDKCRGCVYIKNCTGTWYNYFNSYGTGEISPIIK